MNDLYFEMDCGCKFKQYGTSIKENDGLPPIEIDFYNLPNCKKVWDYLESGTTKGVFQLESHLGQSWTEKVIPKSIDDLAALSAILRPSCLDSFIGDKNISQHYADRKNNREEIEVIHPALEQSLSKNYQLMIYQEDALRIAREVAGFSGVKAEVLRQAIGKKLHEKMQSLKVDFIDGCIKNSGLKREDAEMIFDIIEKSQKYSFNKSILDTTIVRTKHESEKQIKDLRIGEKILCPSDSGDKYFEVLNKFDHGVQEVFKVIFDNGSNITCTIGHKFLCDDGQVRKLHEIIQYGHWIKTLIGDKKIYCVVPCGRKNVVDIEVNSQNHIFYGNRIATSNSHSISYSYTTYAATYIKTHFPYHFYTSWLHWSDEKIDPQRELKDLINDAKLNNVDIYPPCLENLFLGDPGLFCLNNKAIYFGLSSVKGIGNANILKLIEDIKRVQVKIGKRIEYWSWTDFLFNLCPLTNKTVVNNIILIGASPGNITRKRSLFEYKLFSKLTKREIEYIVNKQTNFSSLLDAMESLLNAERKDGGPSNKNRKQLIADTIDILKNPKYDLKDSPEWCSLNESQLLSVSLSNHILDSVDVLGDWTIKEFLDGCSDKGTLICKIDNKKEIIMKKGQNAGKTMAFITLEDKSGKLESICFNNVYEKSKDLIFENNIVAVKGRRSDKDNKSLILTSLEQC